MDHNISVLAGTVSTILFMISTFPMLAKAFRSKDLRSYSFGHILLANGGNAVHSLYIYSLPAGPIWWLHTFHLITTGLMLVWYLRYERLPGRVRRTSPPAASSRTGTEPGEPSHLPAEASFAA